MNRNEDRDFVIEKINAYRRLLGLTLKAVSKDESVQEDVQSEFKDWVELQLNSLMGSPQPGLSGEETIVLKAFAKKLLSSKQENQASKVSASQAGSQLLNGITEQSQQRIVASRARPLKEQARSRESDPLLKSLEEMDREGPSF